ncbi:hypothetical protein LINPERPRIM_LOCUS13817 [Linum perenne]
MDLVTITLVQRLLVVSFEMIDVILCMLSQLMYEICSITRAELRAIVEGLKLAWSIGIRKLAVQTDFRAERKSVYAPAYGLSREFKELHLRDLSFCHVFS